MACSAAAVSLWPRGRDVRTDDRTATDGLMSGASTIVRASSATVAVDTNFDGRSDVHEYYRRGALVRRESDRDFNDRVDLVQEFDATTREAVRSVSDVDFDGVADLLVLFQGGQPVYSEWAHGRSRTALRRLAQPRRSMRSERRPTINWSPLEDPFRGDLAVTCAPRSASAWRLCWACDFRWVTGAASQRRQSPRVFVRRLARQPLASLIRLRSSSIRRAARRSLTCLLAFLVQLQPSVLLQSRRVDDIGRDAASAVHPCGSRLRPGGMRRRCGFAIGEGP